jgi:hypothetical protein
MMRAAQDTEEADFVCEGEIVESLRGKRKDYPKTSGYFGFL